MPVSPWLAQLRCWFDSTMLRNTLWMVAGFAARLGIQVLYFILIARSLQAAEYGIFSGSLALVLFISPFVTWGTGSILIKNVSRQPERFGEYWGAALATTLLLGSVLTVFATLVGWVVLPAGQPAAIVFFLAIGDFFGMCLNELAAQAFQALQRLRYTSFLYVTLSLSRLLAALLFFFSGFEKTALTWAFMHMLSGVLAGGIGYLLVTREMGYSRIALGPMRTGWREGFFFSVGNSSQGIYNDIDKTLLLRLSGDVTAGAYAAAYRFLDAAFVPIRALIYATYPRFFQKGSGGLRESTGFAMRLLPWAGGLALLAGAGLVLVRPVLLFLLGEGYELSLEILPWLALIPLFRAFHYLAANALTGADLQPVRTGVQVGIAALNLLLNLWLIPFYGCLEQSSLRWPVGACLVDDCPAA